MRRLAILTLVGLLQLLMVNAFAAPKVLAPGVSVISERSPVIAAPNLVHIASIDRQAPVAFRLISGFQTATRLCQQAKVLLCVNGGFYNLASGVPVPGKNPNVRKVLGFDVPGLGPGAVTLLSAGSPTKFTHSRFTDHPEPRTIFCQTAAGWKLMVADGRRPGLPGITLDQARALAKQQGCQTAVNADGGESSAMIGQGGARLNLPGKGVVRKLANVVAVVSAPKPKVTVKVLAAAVARRPAPAITELAAQPEQLERVPVPLQPIRPVRHQRSGWLAGLAIASLLAAYIALLTRQRQLKRSRLGTTPAGLHFETKFT